MIVKLIMSKLAKSGESERPFFGQKNGRTHAQIVKVGTTDLDTCVKAAPWDDINSRFQFRTEVVYPTDHVFIFFRIFIFLQIFLINISMNPEVTQTNYLYN